MLINPSIGSRTFAAGQSVVDESSPVTSILAMWSELTEATTLPDAHRSRETLIGRDMPVRRHDRPDSRIRGRVGRRGDAHRDDDGVRQRFPLEAVRVEAIPIAGPASTFTSVARIEAYSVCGRETVRTTGRRLTAFT